MPSSLPGFYTPMSWGDPTPAATGGGGQPDYLASLAPITAGIPAATAAANPSMWDSFTNWMDNSGILGKTLPDGSKMQGWGGMALGAASGLMNGWLGLQQYGLAKDSLAQNKRQFQLNYDAQAKTTNARLEDQQRARIAANPTAYQSVGDYMKKYGIGG